MLLGLALGQGHSLDALRSLASLVGFLVGVVLAALLGAPLGRRAHWPASATRALELEGALLLIFTLWGAAIQPNAETAAILPNVALAGCAMGLQNVVLLALAGYRA